MQGFHNLLNFASVNNNIINNKLYNCSSKEIYKKTTLRGYFLPSSVPAPTQLDCVSFIPSFPQFCTELGPAQPQLVCRFLRFMIILNRKYKDENPFKDIMGRLG